MSSSEKPPKPLKRNPLRPSSLDALWRCAWYRSDPLGTVATERGRLLDDLLRDHFAGVLVMREDVPVADQPAFEWGAETTFRLSRNAPLFTDPQDCRVYIELLNRVGTCDCVAPRSLISFDWKTGQRRAYERQMAAYGLGQMDKNFAPEWTCVVLYLDEQETETFRYGYDEAYAIVAESVAAYDTPGRPVINESCSWCANFYDCPVQRDLAARALTIPDVADLAWNTILDDPALLGRFLDGARALDHFTREAKHRAREYFFQKVKVPGYSLQKGKPSYTVPAEYLLNQLSAGGDELAVRKALRTAVEIMGPISKKDYFDLCSKLGLEPNPNLISESRGEPFVRSTKA
jgi:hypothetical protein